MVLFDISLDVVEDRLSGRWTNPRTGRAYNEKSAPPRVPGIDDDDGGPLVQRDDDKPETVRKRLSVYREQTAPLIGYYEPAGRLHLVDAALGVAEVAKAIDASIFAPGGVHA